MEEVLAVLVGILFSVGAYLMMERSLIRLLFGLVLISNAASLAVFAAGRLTWGEPAIVPAGALAPDREIANALPQALVLTAIVIGFGLIAFALVLAERAFRWLGTVDTEAMRVAEPQPEGSGASAIEADAGRTA